MIKTVTGPRWHWIAGAIATLCLLLGGGIASSPMCGSDSIWTTESYFINHESRLVTAEWHPQKKRYTDQVYRKRIHRPGLCGQPRRVPIGHHYRWR